MISRAVVFEDDENDRRRFEEDFCKAGVEVLSIADSQVEVVASQIQAFNPQLAVVDSHFESDIDGILILAKLARIVPDAKAVVCTVLLNNPAKRHWVTEKYRGAPNLRALLPKDPFPSAEDILYYAQD